MNYLIECVACKCRCWVTGEYEADTNALTLDTDKFVADERPDCPHDEFEVLDEEPPEPMEGDVF